MRRTWSRLGGQLGLGCIALGLLVVGLAWNGAASVDFVSGQVPYLLSGGFLGLALVMTGVGLLVVQNARRDRAMLETQLRELNGAIARLGNAFGSGPAGTDGHTRAAPTGAVAMVALGRSSFHRLDCRLAEGKDLPTSTYDAAVAEGLSPCRICHPEELESLDVARA